MADIEGSKERSTRSRWYRLGCWIWFRISILVLVAILLVAYSVEVWRCSRYQPTGDALYDRYATAVISRQRWILFHGGKHHPTYLPDSMLAEWEDEFGSDPRYWQLRYFCARHKGAFGSGGRAQFPRSPLGYLFGLRRWDTEPTDRERSAWKHLQTGVDKGAADWMTLEILGRETKRLREYAENAEMALIDTLDLDEREIRQLKIELNREQEQKELARIDAVIDADPSQAWPYYRRARYWFYYGEGELALADLKVGNAVPNNEMSKVFPVSLLMERIESGDHLGNKILAGAVFEEDSYSLFQNWIKWKDLYKEALGMVALGGDTEIIQELHLTACRLGMAKNNDNWEPVVAAVYESMLSNNLLVEYGADLTYRQRRTMMEMNKRAQAVQTFLKSRSAEMSTYLRSYLRLRLLEVGFNSPGPGVENVAVNPPDGRPFGRAAFQQYLLPRLYYNRSLWLQQQQHTGVAGVRDAFEQLEHVNLNTLEWPDEWGNPY